MNEPNIVDRAELIAGKMHLGQVRKFGSPPRPYIYHPEQVYRHLAWRLPDRHELLAAAWLHDVVEDCGVTDRELNLLFGPVVSRLVWEVSHPETPPGMPRRERWPIYLEHYGNASEDGKILKLADRFCNIAEYVTFRDEVPEKEWRFIRGVYRDETHELIDCIGHADEETAVRIGVTIDTIVPPRKKEER